MKRIIYGALSVLVLVGTLFMFSAADAEMKYGRDVAASRANYDTSGRTDVYSMVQTIVNAVLILFGFVFFFLMLFGGVRWLTARGNDEFVARAKGYIESAIFGLIIVMGAYAITSFVFGKLGQ